MNKLYVYLVLSALILVCSSVGAQTVSPVDFMRFNPYQMNANPATNLPYKTVMSLATGNIGLDVQNTALRYNNLFEFDAQGHPSKLSFRKFANSVKADNFFGLSAHVDLFTLYRHLNTCMLTFNYGVKFQNDFRYNDGVIQLLGYGNGSFVGEDNPVKINMGMNMNAYQEFAVGCQLNVNDYLSLGWRTKLLFGLINVTTDAFDAQIYTDAETYAVRMKEDIVMKAALPRAIYINENGGLMGNGPFSFGELFRNLGFGIDLAAECRFNEQFSAVATVHDLGFIHWGLNNISMTGHREENQPLDNGDFLFDGVSNEQLYSIEYFLDTLKQYFQLEYASIGSYNSKLNTNLLLRGNYDINPYNRFSVQFQGCFFNSGFRPAVTLAYCGPFFRNLNVCAPYTAKPHSYDNIGLGFSWMMGTCNVYLTTNDLIGCFKPLNASAFNAQVGIVFNLFKEERQPIEEPNMPEYLE